MSTLEDNVRSWLSRHGYPLELRVAGLLRQAGLSADHHRVYADPVTAKSREIDVVGYLDHSKLSVHLVIECKHSAEKPWILFCTSRPTLTPQGYVEAMPATAKAREALTSVGNDQRVHAMAMFKAPSLIGFRLVQAHTENQDTAYSAVLGVVNACLSSAKEIGTYGHRVIYVPVIIVNTPLLLCHLPPGSSELGLISAPRGFLFHTFATAGHAPIHVIHADALAKFIEEIKHDAMELCELITSVADQPTSGT